jgi:hypothetical protein
MLARAVAERRALVKGLPRGREGCRAPGAGALGRGGVGNGPACGMLALVPALKSCSQVGSGETEAAGKVLWLELGSGRDGLGLNGTEISCTRLSPQGSVARITVI